MSGEDTPMTDIWKQPVKKIARPHGSIKTELRLAIRRAQKCESVIFIGAG